MSERATIERLLAYIHELNQQLDVSSPARLTDEDVGVIRDAIAATICTYNPNEQAIYQSNLYEQNSTLPIVARILALADIGALGMEGIQVYNQEGSLLFLEENLDIIPLLEESCNCLASDDPDLRENLRQRLLKRSRFQVNFAKSRLARFEYEMVGFPEKAVPTLMHEVFQYLTPATIKEVEAITPTDEEASLEDLLKFFKFQQYLKVKPSR